MRLEVTDNLFLTSTNTNIETIAIYGPTLNLSQNSRLLDLELDYAYEIYRYLDEPLLNNKVDTHLGKMAGTILPGRDFSIALGAEARLEAIDRRISDTTDSATINTTNRYSANVRPTYRFNFGSKHSGELAYLYELVEYEEETADDTESHTAELMFERKQSSQLRLRVVGKYEQFFPKTLRQEYEEYENYQGMLGVIWNPNSTIEITAFGGVSRFEFRRRSEYESDIHEASIHLAATSKLALDLGYSDNFAYDITDGLYELQTADATITHTSRFGWKLGYIYRDSVFLRLARADLEHGVLGEISYQATRNILVKLQGNSHDLEFKPLIEKVARNSIGISIQYTPRDRVSMGCRYVYRNNDSDIDSNDYVENRAYCEVRWAFALIQ